MTAFHKQYEEAKSERIKTEDPSDSIGQMTENAKEGGEKLGLSASERESEKNNVKP